LRVPDVILEASNEGINDVPKVPVVILEASNEGINDVAKVPDVILATSNEGIYDVPNVPDVILATSNEGICDDVKLVKPEPLPDNTPLLSIVKASIEFVYNLILLILG